MQTTTDHWAAKLNSSPSFKQIVRIGLAMLLSILGVLLLAFGLHWMKLFFDQNPSAAQVGGETIKSIIIWGALAIGALYIAITVAAGVGKLTERFDISAQWRWPLNLLSAVFVAMVVNWGALLAKQSASHALWLAYISAGVTFSLADVVVGQHLSDTAGSKDFKPFRVHMEPVWWACLSEHEIVNEERWRELWAEIERKAGQTFHYDTSFTLLSPKLFFSDHSHHFFTELPRISLDAVWRDEWMFNLDYFVNQYKVMGLPSQRRPFGPKFDVRERYDHRMKCVVWEFSLITDESWARADQGYRIDEAAALIPLAILPREVFAVQYGMTLSKKRQERLAKLVEQTGWVQSDGNPWTALTHKFVTINYRHV
jgi:hypothetical protein